MTKRKKLPLSFYQRDDVVAIARDLVGTFIYTQWGDDPITGGMIIETEAYGGATDKASHAYGGKNTPRTSTLFQDGGVAYIYLCYGIHHLLNIVTHKKGTPHGVLIRAIEPLTGIETMLARRHGRKPIANGPGTVSQALGVNMQHKGQSVLSNSLWLEPRKLNFDEEKILITKRIGIDYAEDHADLPWRFRLNAKAS